MDYPPQTSIVLVAVVPQPRDLEIARVLGWYRIPLRFAPKIIDVDFLAFYQPASFGKDHRWKVEYFAEVKGNELTTRRELFRDEPDHPRASEEYYKIQLGELTGLQSPIRVEKWKRLTFLYTFGEMLSNAERIEDLILKSERRELLWRTLKDKALNNKIYRSNVLDSAEIDPEILAFLGGLGKLMEKKSNYLD